MLLCCYICIIIRKHFRILIEELPPSTNSTRYCMILEDNRDNNLLDFMPSYHMQMNFPSETTHDRTDRTPSLYNPPIDPSSLDYLPFLFCSQLKTGYECGTPLRFDNVADSGA